MLKKQPELPKAMSDKTEAVTGNFVPRGPFKLKDKLGRSTLQIDLEKVFGFIPRKILIDKVIGQANTFMVVAEETKENKVQQVGGSGLILPGNIIKE